METKKYKTIKYFKASELEGIQKSHQVEGVLSSSSPEDSIAVLLTINSPVKIEKAVNITKEGFGKVKELTI